MVNGIYMLMWHYRIHWQSTVNDLTLVAMAYSGDCLGICDMLIVLSVVNGARLLYPSGVQLLRRTRAFTN